MKKAGICSKLRYILKSVEKTLLPIISISLFSTTYRPRFITKEGIELLLYYAIFLITYVIRFIHLSANGTESLGSGNSHLLGIVKRTLFQAMLPCFAPRWPLFLFHISFLAKSPQLRCPSLLFSRKWGSLLGFCHRLQNQTILNSCLSWIIVKLPFYGLHFRVDRARLAYFKDRW